MTLKVRVLMVGKTRETWLAEALSLYEQRLRGSLEIEWVALKDDEALLKAAEKEPRLVGLDASGKMMDSASFSRWLFGKLEEGGSRIAFVIGGAQGLPASLKCTLSCVSLSPMTFTHQIVRLILAEQIYRAHEIRMGTAYHK